MEGFVNSWVNNDDIVSRLSLLNVAKLCEKGLDSLEAHVATNGQLCCAQCHWCGWVGARVCDCLWDVGKGQELPDVHDSLSGNNGDYGGLLNENQNHTVSKQGNQPKSPPSPPLNPSPEELAVSVEGSGAGSGSGISTASEVHIEVDREEENEMAKTELFLAGRIVHLRLNNPASGKQRNVREVVGADGYSCREYEAVVASRDDFREIDLTPDMFLDHIPWRYAHAIDGLIKASHVQASGLSR